MTSPHQSPTTSAFYSLPADIQEAAFDAIGRLPRPMSHMEILLAVGKAVLAERQRCAKAYMFWAEKMMKEAEVKEE